MLQDLFVQVKQVLTFNNDFSNNKINNTKEQLDSLSSI